MRAIEFTAFYPKGNPYGVEEGLLVPCLSEFNDMNDEIANIQENGVIFMQFTNEKADDGTKIYEGHILRVTSDDESYITKVGMHGVWHEVEVRGLDYDMTSINHLRDTMMDCVIEVLGNIHQHAHLLEKPEDEIDNSMLGAYGTNPMYK